MVITTATATEGHSSGGRAATALRLNGVHDGLTRSEPRSVWLSRHPPAIVRHEHVCGHQAVLQSVANVRIAAGQEDDPDDEDVEKRMTVWSNRVRR
jgi:hypothetical protein